MMCLEVCVCVHVRVYLQLLLQLRVVLLQTVVDPLQLCCSLVLAEVRGRVQLIVEDLVLHLVGLELLRQVHLTHLRENNPSQFPHHFHPHTHTHTQ